MRFSLRSLLIAAPLSALAIVGIASLFRDKTYDEYPIPSASDVAEMKAWCVDPSVLGDSPIQVPKAHWSALIHSLQPARVVHGREVGDSQTVLGSIDITDNEGIKTRIAVYYGEPGTLFSVFPRPADLPRNCIYQSRPPADFIRAFSHAQNASQQ